VIEDGTAEVEQDGRLVNTLGAGDFFHYQALARSDVPLLEEPGRGFEFVVRKRREERDHPQPVGSDSHVATLTWTLGTDNGRHRIVTKATHPFHRADGSLDVPIV
jgi:hypothetical protein